MLWTFAGRIASLGLNLAKDAPLSKRTTLRVGGPADYLVEARDAGELSAAIAAAKEAGVPALVLGNGSNVLFPDEGYRGLVICTSKMAAVRADGNRVIAEAGAPLFRVGQAAQKAGLTGFEAISGIPGTVGGAVYMNAGAYGTEMARVVESVDAVDADGRPRTLTAAELRFGYRHSALMDFGWTVTGATFLLAPGEPAAIDAATRDYAERRKSTQPLSMPSAGSFFKRPEGHFAGALIEEAGLKGASVGGAQVSEKHAGFLVNTGNATANDFLELMLFVQDRVMQMSGVRLEPEVRILRCNSSC